MSITKALRFLGAVAERAESLRSELDGHHPAKETARNVVGVFKAYEHRLRAMEIWSDMRGLGNTERDLVSRIVIFASTALEVLEEGGDNLSRAFDRAYKNGEFVDDLLEKLTGRLTAAASVPQAVAAGSSARHDEQYSNRSLTTNNPASTEIYRAVHAVPPRPDNVHLAFDSKDEDGKHCCPEGNLKWTLLQSTPSKNVIAAGGAVIHGVSGMAGVGKTTALIALGHDEDVRSRFHDGVLLIELGADVLVKDIIVSIAHLMRCTGAGKSADAVQQEGELKNAVRGAARWYQGRCNLFLIDDIWPTSGRDEGYLTVLRQLLTGSEKSRIVLTTRNRDIVSSVGSAVDFDARDPLGFASRCMFMSHATNGGSVRVNNKDQNLPSVEGILRLCAGLPIALAVTGHRVAAEMMYGLEFKDACDEYFGELEESSSLGGTVLERLIAVSLRYLDEKVLPSLKLGSKYKMHDMYVSLCVFQKQQHMPTSVLARMWGVADAVATRIVRMFASMSLAKSSMHKSVGDKKERGLRLHDLHSDFCRFEAEKNSVKTAWHARLLQGHMPSLCVSIDHGVEHDFSLPKILEHKSQAWYGEDVPNRPYLLQNLSRHLGEAGLVAELWGVVLDPKWWCSRQNSGGLASLKHDIVCLEKRIRILNSRDVSLACQCLRSLSRCLEASHPESFRSAQAASFSVLSQLNFNEARESEAMSLVTKSVQKLTPKPYFVPITSKYKSPDKALQAKVNFGNTTYVEYSPCGGYLAVLAKKPWRVIVVDSGSRDSLKESTFEIDKYAKLRFASSEKIAVTLQQDYTIGVWEWESSETPTVVLRGHTDKVTSISWCSNGEKLFSASKDGTVKAWNVSGGAAFRSIPIDGAASKGIVHGDILAVRTEQGRNNRLEVTAHHGNDAIRVLHSCEMDGYELAFSTDGKYLAFSSDKNINVLKTNDWISAFAPLSGHTREVTCLDFSPDSQRLVLGLLDGTVCVLSTNDGALLGVAGADIDAIIWSVAFHPNGDTIATSSDDGAVRFWSASLMEDRRRRQGACDEMHVLRCSLSGDGKRALVLGRSDRKASLSLFNTSDGSEIETLEFSRGIICVALDLSGSRAAYGDDTGRVYVWDTLQLFARKKCWYAHHGKVKDVSFDRDGARLVSGGWDDLIGVWDTATGRQLCSISVNQMFRAVALSADGEFVIFSCRSRGTKIWRTSSQELLFDSKDSSALSDIESTRDTLAAALRSCGPKSCCMWPDSLPRQSGDLLAKDSGRQVYYKSENEKIPSQSENVLLAGFPGHDRRWQFNAAEGIFAKIDSGTLALCRLEK